LFVQSSRRGESQDVASRRFLTRICNASQQFSTCPPSSSNYKAFLLTCLLRSMYFSAL
jgi:hypothetical protein